MKNKYLQGLKLFIPLTHFLLTCKLNLSAANTTKIDNNNNQVIIVQATLYKQKALSKIDSK